MTYTADELNNEGIRQWSWIKDNFSKTSILLGNGFSINFSETLRYKFLYEFFIKDSSKEAIKLFETFDTKNFERILENIEVAKTVNATLNFPEQDFEKFKIEIRQGLIDSINKIHPKPIDVNQDQIKHIAKQFLEFNQVFTTNYDLFLYYIILETKKFGDHFFTKISSKYNSFADRDKMNSNHIYYLHGALFLYESGLITYKLKKIIGDWLLDGVTEEIAKNNYPLFISEGKSETKLKAIKSNTYLSFCLDQFEKNTDKSLIIFGQSLSDQDEHLVKIIDKSYERLAISIRSEDWGTTGQLNAEKHRLSSYFTQAQFVFYDAKSLFDFDPKMPAPKSVLA
jgi:hypothetical protein